jgi:hypothetical protein
MQKKLSTQLTLVSHYGTKSPDLIQFIKMLQNKLSENLLSSFRPYEIDQVHGTIIGLEVCQENNIFYSEWMKKNKGVIVSIKVNELIALLKSINIPNIKIKIGGYRVHKTFPFNSRDLHPYFRSFSVQGDIAVAMGWPIDDSKNYTSALFQYRTKFEEFNFCHKWHKNEYQDNDFFFVLGRIDKNSITRSQLESTSEEIRTTMAGLNEEILINNESLSLIAYVDPQLPTSTSFQIMLDDIKLSENYIYSLLMKEIDYA